MAKYILTNQWSEINEKEGALPNNSVLYPVLLAASTTWPDVNTPYAPIASGETQNFKAAENEKIYARLFTNNNDATFEVSVVTFIPEQIQNCYVELGTEANPLVGVIDVKNGAYYKVQMDGQLGQGYGTCFGGSNGMSGIIDRDNGSIHIGEGYENLMKDVQIIDSSWKFSNQTLSITNYDEYQNLSGVSDSVSGYGFLKNIDTGNLGEKGSFLSKIRNNGDNDVVLKGNKFILDEIILPGETKTINDIYSYSVGGAFQLYLYVGGVSKTFDIDYWYDKQYIKNNSSIVPFVPNSAPNGRLVIDEGLTSETHSFIGVGAEMFGSQPLAYVSSYANGFFERLAINIIGGYAKDVDFICTDSYRSGFTKEGGPLSATMSDKGITLNKFAPFAKRNTENFSNSFRVFLIYKGDLGEEDGKAELAKIKSEKYVIPQKFIGTPYNIPYASRKSDDNGLTYETIQADTSRDLWLADEYGFYEFIPKSNLVPQYGYVEKVNDVWTIPSFFTNVSGILRVTELGQIRKVK